MFCYSSQFHSMQSVLWVLLFYVSINKPNCYSSYCEAQKLGQSLAVNVGADLSELISRSPQSPFARLFSTLFKRYQNQIVTKSGEARGLLSNDARRVKFWVYNNRRYIESSFQIDPEGPHDFQRFWVKPNSQIKILIHGFNSNPGKHFPQDVKNAYLEATDHTVIVVDWSDLAAPAAKPPISGVLYPSAAYNTVRAGLRVADLIGFLLYEKIISDLDQVHLVGHSLGAHVAGFAGLSVQYTFGKKIGRITGLDPAFPLFRSNTDTHRIDSSDASFVDVVHTSPAGLYAPVGDVDFYPNGGTAQPHCLSWDKSAFLTCSHLSAYEYFIKSIYTKSITACRCNTWQEYRQSCRFSCPGETVFGEYTSQKARGRYFLYL